ncbi:MAG: hypothetical protein SPH82_04445 [Eubacteriales bacterium]|nr:hypothetical protein [Eubacteriales bacterium]
MKKMKKTKRILLLALVVAILACGVGGTIAYLITNTGSVVNTFQPAYVTSEVQETFNTNVKSEVKIKNTGNVSAYIRAAIVITWQDADDNTMPAQPVAGKDYTLDLNAGTETGQWTKAGDYYYYNSVVAAKGTTNNLINSCSPIYTNYTDGRKLCVEVIGSAIQAEGMGATSAEDAFAAAAKQPSGN